MKYHSLIFVPAKEKMLNKVGKMEADAYIIDLEDSIEDSDKLAALERVCNFLADSPNRDNIFVRINKEHCKEELEKLDAYFPVGFMLPKIEKKEDYAKYEEIICKHKVIALVETPKGLSNVAEIAKCEWVDALAFGAEDYTAASNMLNEMDILYWHKSFLIMNAKAENKSVYDTPSFQLEDVNLLQKEVSKAVAMGFDGKLAINPKQINIINEEFKVHDLENMKLIIDKYEEAGQAVRVIDNKVYEKMHINHMKKIISENGGN